MMGERAELLFLRRPLYPPTGACGLPTIRYLGKERPFLEARALFLAARSDEGVAALGRSTTMEATLLRARCFLRLADPAVAVQWLHRARSAEMRDHMAAEFHSLLATSLARCGRQAEAREQYDAAARIALDVGGTAALELALYRAVDAWAVRDLDETLRIATEAQYVDRLSDDPYARSFDVVRSQLLELVSLIAASREQYTLQAGILLKSWSVIANVPESERDAWVEASLLRNLAPLVWDLHLVHEAEFLQRAVSRISWTPEIASARYTAHRALAWNSALEGDHVAAFLRYRECADLAPTIPWRIASTLDRAFLASEMREKTILREEMLRASELARSVNWDSIVGEEVQVLLEVAEAFAREDAGLARHWLDRYDRERAMPAHLFLLATHDRRQSAMEFDAEAAVLAAEGRRDDAIAKRRMALTIWDQLEHGWRAARTAIALAQLTGSPDDATRAVWYTDGFRRSWLKRRARRFSPHEAQPGPRATPAT